jgi:hypothetical protein
MFKVYFGYMDFLYAAFLAIGITAFAYTKLQRRTGYGNTQSILPSLGAIFIISLFITFTIFKFIIHL